jgi:NADH-quinone oxidoreductase subunit L
MSIENLAWIILLLPLAGAAGVVTLARRQPLLSARLAASAAGLAFAASVLLFRAVAALDLPPGEYVGTSWRWLSAGELTVDFGLRIDGLSALMLLVVTGVGWMIHIFSRGYMHGDAGVPRYFAGLGLFLFSMLGIVLAANFVVLFMVWELVGLSSYLLIGHWRERPSAADACKKAFLTNRLGDFGFLLGILLLWAAAGSVDYRDIERHLATRPGALGDLASIAGLLIFCGAMGKSAQFPLHVWLPDAMEGPTPVSALIHAATMVAAGVYMLCRVFFLFEVPAAWPEAFAGLAGWSALDVIGWVGGITALLAALMACQQDDIKRVLAYSTLSQLGYMVMAVGVAAPAAAMFHLSAHAFFKALLFLGAGAVIHALHHEQDIWRMGGLRASMPWTSATFGIGALALCGVPPLSGFYSKDAVLAALLQPERGSVALFVLGLVVALLTSFYMGRLVCVAFFGTARSEGVRAAHDPPGGMHGPLLVLAVPSVFAGWWGLDAWLGRALGAAEHGTVSWSEIVFGPFNHAPMAAMFGIAAVLFGFSAAWALYRGAATDPLPARAGWLASVLRRRFFLDEIYTWLIALTHEALAAAAAAADRWLVAGVLVRGAHGTTELVGRGLRLLQTGNVQTYALIFAVGSAVILFLVTRS